MRTFKDTADRAWTILVNVDAIKRVRALLDVNLLEAVDGKLLERLISDPVLLCDVIFCLVKPEADAQSVSDEEFGRAMGGDAIEHATQALLEELVDFFPSQRRRLLRKALQKLEAVEKRAIEVAEKRLDDPALDREIERVLRESGDSSLNLPGRLESTQGHSP